MILTLMIALGVAFVVLVVLGLRAGAKGRGYLDWDPNEELERRAQQEDVDIEEMLHLHNSRRMQQGLDPVTLAEYTEAVRRGAR
jgi:hypothetical protein